MKKIVCCLVALLLLCYGEAEAKTKKTRPGHLKSPCVSGHWALRQNTYYACGQDQKWKELDSVTFLYEDEWLVTYIEPKGIYLSCVNHQASDLDYVEAKKQGKVNPAIPEPIGILRVENMEYVKLGEHYYVCGDNEAHKSIRHVYTVK